MPYISGLYAGVDYRVFDLNTASDVSDLDAALQELVDKKKQDSVVSLVMFPSQFVSQSGSVTSVAYGVLRPTTLDGYTPRNKKLLTYPYNFLCVDSLNDSKNYRYEWFADPDTSCDFRIYGSMSPNPEILCAPDGYNGHFQNPLSADSNVTESVVCSGFPQCAFTIDTFRAWIAQKAAGEVISVAGTAAGVVAGAAVGGPVGAVAAGVLGSIGIGGQINSMVQEATQGSKVRGNTGSSVEVSIKQKDFYFKEMGVTAQYARMIDDFFDRYGYACCRVKYPNRNVRPHWTYTKTQNCTIDGNVPADDLEKIKSIYNNGITFWRNGSEVGLYTLNNSPT